MKRLLLVILLTFSGYFGSFFSPFYGLCIYLWFAYIRAQEWAWGANWFIAMRPSLTLAICVALGALMRGEKLYRGSTITRLLILLWIFLLISFLDPVHKGNAAFWFDYVTKVIVTGFFITGLVITKKRLIGLLVTLCMSIGFYGGKCGLWAILKGGAKILQGPGGMYQDNNTFALAFVMLLPLLYFTHDLITNARYLWFKKGFRLIFFFTLLAVIFTYSRGGFLGLVVVVTMINIRSKKKFTTWIFMGILALIIGLFFIPQEYKDRLNTIFVDEGEEREASSASRLHFWKVAIDMVNDNPITGVGPGCYNAAYNKYDFLDGEYGTSRAVHSSLFQFLTNNGYPAFIIFCMLIFISIRTCMRIRKAAYRRKDLSWIVSVANMLEISIWGYCVSGLFVSMAYADLLYHEFCIVAAFELIARQHLSKKKEEKKEEVIVEQKILPA